jgi:UDPglucose 6-dehydrogenase
MRVTVVGTGYVGLVAGACFADSGNDVVCADTDKRKVDGLRRGEMPIYEEGLGDIVTRCAREGRLAFTENPGPAMARAEVIFVAVGTPPGAGGEADLSAVLDVARTAARHVPDRADAPPVLFVLKSTVPVGTNDKVTRLLREAGHHSLEVVNNPEFLKEGVAISDFRRPDRVVVGVRSERAAEVMRDLYEPFCRTGAPILVMDPASAEMVKYASNAMLATRISFMNDMAALCDRVGADVDQVRKGVGTDRRIGPTFLVPGVGYGGSCFPKDVKALVQTAREQDLPFTLLEEVERTNERQKHLLVQKLDESFRPLGGLAGRTVALWGLAFKPQTDDMREAPALVIIEGLLARGARVRAHDPAALARAGELLRAPVAAGQVVLCTGMYEALQGADALAVATEWGEYRRPDFGQLKAALRQPWIFDGRNMWEREAMARRGFLYRSVGRPDAAPGQA